MLSVLTRVLGCSVLSALCLCLGCERGGAFDPLEHLFLDAGLPDAQPPSELPLCSGDSPQPPCRLPIDNLTFRLDSCDHLGDTRLGQTFWNPKPGTLQFAVDENSKLTSCDGFAQKTCTATLTNLPPLYNQLSGRQFRLTYQSQYALANLIGLTTGNVSSLQQARAQVKAGGQPLITIDGERRLNGGLELHTTSLYFAPSPLRDLSFVILTTCNKGFDLHVYWKIENLVVEALP